MKPDEWVSGIDRLLDDSRAVLRERGSAREEGWLLAADGNSDSVHGELAGSCGDEQFAALGIAAAILRLLLVGALRNAGWHGHGDLRVAPAA